jgi:RNA polymerase sigma factor (sigma-70 family)
VETHPVGRLDFDHLYRTHQKDLLRYAASILRQDADVEDAAAEAWARAWEERESWEDRGHPPRAWLITLTKLACLNTISRYRDHPWLDLDVAAPHLEDPGMTQPPYPGLTDPETHAALERVWPYMGERNATAVWLRHIGGYTWEEIAGILETDRKGAFSLAADGLRTIHKFFRGEHRYFRWCRVCGFGYGTLGHRSTCG